MAMLGYTFQLYFDFSGYSTMAVGLGYLFGLRIPQNFNSPYKATDPSDFWRRWHISLSSVLRDYLYIPLGGNRNGTAQTYRNLVITMLLGGLWHGASWTFVVWGAYHGMLLSLYRAFSATWDSLSAAFRRAATFVLVVIGWVFFRATDFSMALSLLRKMFSPVRGALVPQPELAALAIGIAAAWAMAGPNAFQMRHEYKWPGPRGSRVGICRRAGNHHRPAHVAVPLLSVLNRRNRDDDSTTRADIGRRVRRSARARAWRPRRAVFRGVGRDRLAVRVRARIDLSGRRLGDVSRASALAIHIDQRPHDARRRRHARQAERALSQMGNERRSACADRRHLQFRPRERFAS
jgi:hypothetical protein